VVAEPKQVCTMCTAFLLVVELWPGTSFLSAVLVVHCGTWLELHDPAANLAVRLMRASLTPSMSSLRPDGPAGAIGEVFRRPSGL